MLTGLTSITFRQLTIDRLITLVKEAGLDGIEWGGDVHIPPASPALAAETAKKCAEAGLRVLSYGSYWKCGKDESFDDVLESAAALGAPIIRIWAGSLPSEETDDETFRKITGSIRTAVEKAAARGIRLATEYHRGTLTQTKEGALRLLDAVDGLMTYWQPNPDVTFEEQLREIDAVGDRLAHLHAFAWEKGNIRYPLEHAAEKWRAYLAHANAFPADDRAILIEFVQNDTPEQFLTDASLLRELAR